MARIVQSERMMHATTCLNISPLSPPLSRCSSSIFTTKRPVTHRRHYAKLHIVSATDFHQKRLSASAKTGQKEVDAGSLPALKSTGALMVRMGERDDELEAASWLRARSFYAYPEERKFAGEIHQAMVAEEEFTSLKASRLNRILAENSSPYSGEESTRERSACLVALYPTAALGEDGEADEKLLLTDDGDTWLTLVGTLDLHAVRAMPDEVLIGNCSNAAYLANVCTAPAARRRGVGESLLQEARNLAKKWGVEGIYVHTLAVNEIAMKFYDRNGFVVEKEETANQAHYRGRCLDGIEGRGRSVLLRDTLLVRYWLLASAAFQLGLIQKMLLADCSILRPITALDPPKCAQLKPAYSLERVEVRRRLILSEQRKKLARCHAASSDDDSAASNVDMAASAFAKATAAGVDADEATAQQMGAVSASQMTSVQEKYKDKVKEKLESRAEELRKEREARAIKFSQGKVAYERGQYDTAARLFETALNEEGPFTQLGGEIQMWLALAYQACGRNEECIEQCKAIENSHPVPSIRRQAAEMRYILEAPKLEIKKEEKVQIPVLTDLDPNKGGRAPPPRPRVAPKKERPKTWDEEFWANYEPPKYLKNRYVWVAAAIVLVALAWYSVELPR